MGEKAAGADIQQGLHHENFELSTVEGRCTYDVLFDLLDPKFVKFQFQVSTISRGASLPSEPAGVTNWHGHKSMT